MRERRKIYLIIGIICWWIVGLLFIYGRILYARNLKGSLVRGSELVMIHDKDRLYSAAAPEDAELERLLAQIDADSFDNTAVYQSYIESTVGMPPKDHNPHIENTVLPNQPSKDAVIHNTDTAYGKRVACIGDSITCDGGYIWQLQQLCPGYRFDNYGISGQTSSQIRRRINAHSGSLNEKQVNLSEYDQIIVLAGINNIAEPETVKRDLQAIYDEAHDQGLRVIAVTISPWKNYETWTIKKQANTEYINEWILSYPRNVDVVVNIYDILEDNNNPGCLRNDCRDADRLHPRYKGQRIIGKQIFTTAFTD